MSSDEKDAEVDPETMVAEDDAEPKIDEFTAENSVVEADRHPENDDFVVAEANPEPTARDADPHSATDDESFQNDSTKGDSEM